MDKAIKNRIRFESCILFYIKDDKIRNITTLISGMKVPWLLNCLQKMPGVINFNSNLYFRTWVLCHSFCPMIRISLSIVKFIFISYLTCYFGSILIVVVVSLSLPFYHIQLKYLWYFKEFLQRSFLYFLTEWNIHSVFRTIHNVLQTVKTSISKHQSLPQDQQSFPIWKQT